MLVWRHDSLIHDFPSLFSSSFWFHLTCLLAADTVCMLTTQTELQPRPLPRTPDLDAQQTVDMSTWMSAVHFKLNMSKCKLLAPLAHSHLWKTKQTKIKQTLFLFQDFNSPLAYFLFFSNKKKDLDCTSQIIVEFSRSIWCLPKFLQKMVRACVFQILPCHPPSLISSSLFSHDSSLWTHWLATTFPWRYRSYHLPGIPTAPHRHLWGFFPLLWVFTRMPPS